MGKHNLAVIVVDRSGSMEPLAKEGGESINEVIKTIGAENPNNKVFLAQFNGAYEVVEDYVDASQCKKYKLNASGVTALYDAIGFTIQRVGKLLNDLPQDGRPEKILVSILTDGEENSSREFDFDKIKEMIEHQRSKYSWEFVFLSSDLRAVSTAQSLGMFTNTYKPTGAGNTARGIAMANTYTAFYSGTPISGAVAAGQIAIDNNQ